MAGSPAYLDFLTSLDLLEGIRNESLFALANSARLVPVRKGSYLFYQSDPASSFYIVYSGELMVILASSDGREIIISEMQTGECFGEVSLLSTGLRTAGAQAKLDSEVLEFPSSVLFQVLESEQQLARRMLAIASQRLSNAQQRESALAFMDAPNRVARILLKLDEADRTGPDRGFVTISQEEIAQRAGLTRQTVANSLGRWRREGWILTGRGRIVILNREALKRETEEVP